MDFRERTVVITGGTGALGAAVVEAFLAAGAACHIPYLFEEELRSFPHRDCVTLYPQINLTDEATVGRFFEQVPTLWASVHLVGGFAFGAIASAGKAIIAGQLDVNVVTCYLTCRAAILAMADKGGGGGGRIVNVAARPALEWRSGANMAAYTASKAAVAALTAALAEEVVGQGILVNAVAPSILDTPANRKAMPKADHTAWPKVEEVARTILFLASPDNKVTRGAIVPVYGRV